MVRGTNNSRYYPNGFTNVMDISGSTYMPPPFEHNRSGLSLMVSSEFVNGNLPSQPDYNATLNFTDNNVYVNGKSVLRAYFFIGIMTGTLIDSTLHVTRSIRGVVLQQENTFRGYILGTNQSGRPSCKASNANFRDFFVGVSVWTYGAYR